MRHFTSESGDDFYIPDAQYSADVAGYRAAVERGDESTMLKYETGETGWRTTPRAKDGHFVPGPWAPQSDCFCEACKQYFASDAATKQGEGP